MINRDNAIKVIELVKSGKAAGWVLQGFALGLATASAVALLVALLHIYAQAWSLLVHGNEQSTKALVESILDGFVIIELFRSFVDYIEYHRLHISLLLETALVFVLREMASGLYRGHTSPGLLVGYAVLIPALLLARKLAIADGED